ncbi:MAG TPA: transglutaminase family protein [Stellaceae bacterium]|jgi:transglutaminase-like putative cysteine protease|nr:transglutaminase family protein [Stellaceae bacterium]
MRLAIRHTTAYRYSQPITYAIQALRLTPRPYEGFNVISWRVRGEGRHELPSFVDGYGNIVHCHTVNRAHDHAAIVVEGDVETSASDGIVRGAVETLPPLFYLRPTRQTAIDEAIRTLALSVSGKGYDRLLAWMEAVRAQVDYRTGTTDAATTAAEALRAGAGVCQDHAHLFIAGARAMGIPARYVGGYLWTGGDGAGEASHAWAEAYLADFGWIGFDPSNRCLPGEAYVRASIGLDYWSAAPVRGVRRGPGEESLAVEVKVRESSQQQQ